MRLARRKADLAAASAKVALYKARLQALYNLPKYGNAKKV